MADRKSVVLFVTMIITIGDPIRTTMIIVRICGPIGGHKDGMPIIITDDVDNHTVTVDDYTPVIHGRVPFCHF